MPLDDAGELVAEHDGRGGQQPPIELHRIRAAHSADRDAHERLAGPGLGDRPVLDAQVAHGVEHGRAHARHPAVADIQLRGLPALDHPSEQTVVDGLVRIGVEVGGQPRLIFDHRRHHVVRVTRPQAQIRAAVVGAQFRDAARPWSRAAR